MTPERYQFIKQVFLQAVERPPAERDAYLAQACQADPKLREEVEFLLTSDECATSFIEQPALHSVATILDDIGETEEQPRWIGPYEVDRLIGSGGMGSVYRAVRADDQYRKQVAIKLVRRGMETEAIVQRFRRERQILANLDHPNIAQLLDGGTTSDGRPYFVMEYVEGTAIDTYCDERRLSTRMRLELFRTVCSAVAYAHRNLVIHRDLKPGNVLVKKDGTIKLLDFGIAKVLHPDPKTQALERTATALRIMTPQYASPEQVRGDSLTTASDVYLLGVVLYELLTGHRPYQIRSTDTQDVMRVLAQGEPEKPSTAISRVVEEKEPDGSTRTVATPDSVSKTREGRPGALRRLLSGDIDHIVLKALRHEPARRYSSAEELSEDIRRYLDGLPVLARKQTTGYRAAKFVARHRVVVFAAAAVAVIFATSLGGWYVQERVANVEAGRLERHLAGAHRAVKQLLEAASEAGGQEVSAALAVVRAYLADIDPAGDPALSEDVAVLYSALGKAETAFWGTPEPGAASHRRAAELREHAVAREGAPASIRRDLTSNYLAIGAGLAHAGELEGARNVARKAVAQAEASSLPAEAAHGYSLIAQIEMAAGSISDAVANTSAALQAARQSGDGSALADAFERQGDVNQVAGNTILAAEGYSQSLAAWIGAGKNTASRGPAREAARVERKLLAVQARMGVTPEILERVRRIVVAHEQNQRSPAGTIALALTLIDAADVEQRSTAVVAAASKRERAVELLNNLGSANPPVRREVIRCYARLTQSMEQSGQAAAAARFQEGLIQVARTWDTADPTTIELLGFAYMRLSELLGKSADRAKSLENARLASSLFESLVGREGKSARLRMALAHTYARVGDALAEMAADSSASGVRAESWREARGWYQRGQAAWEEYTKLAPESSRASGFRERIRDAINRCDQAIAGRS